MIARRNESAIHNAPKLCDFKTVGMSRRNYIDFWILLNKNLIIMLNTQPTHWVCQCQVSIKIFGKSCNRVKWNSECIAESLEWHSEITEHAIQKLNAWQWQMEVFVNWTLLKIIWITFYLLDGLCLVEYTQYIKPIDLKG